MQFQFIIFQDYMKPPFYETTVTHGSLVNQLFNEYLAEVPANLNCLFYKLVNTTSTPIECNCTLGNLDFVNIYVSALFLN